MSDAQIATQNQNCINFTTFISVSFLPQLSFSFKQKMLQVILIMPEGG